MKDVKDVQLSVVVLVISQWMYGEQVFFFFVESSWQKVKLGWSGILIGNREGRDPPRQLRWYFLGERGVCRRMPPSGLGLNFLEPSALKTNSIVWNLIHRPYTVNPSHWVCSTVTFSLSFSFFDCRLTCGMTPRLLPSWTTWRRSPLWQNRARS